jgi:hypothetical protein
LPLRRQVEDKLLALLNMRGRHRYKWDFLRAVLADKVVYDDNAFRVWYAPGSNGCGLLYATKQAQVRFVCICGGAVCMWCKGVRFGGS